MSTVSQNTISYVMSLTGSEPSPNELVVEDEGKDMLFQFIHVQDDDAEILRQFNEHKRLIEQHAQESTNLKKQMQEYSERAQQEFEEKRKYQEQMAKRSIQEILREFLSREEFSVTTQRIIKIQSLWRKVLAQKKYNQLGTFYT